MSTERPYAERPAARPSNPVDSEVSPPLNPPRAKKRGPILAVITSILIAGTGLGIYSAVTATSKSEDPIEQARVVLDEAYSYDFVKRSTDAALSSTGTAINQDNYSRAWSSVLEVAKADPELDAMTVMLCVAEGSPTSGVDFPTSAALCATYLRATE